MQLRWAMGVVMAALGVVAAAGQPPRPVADPRIVIVVGWPTDPRVGRQHRMLADDDDAMRERDVVVQDITPEAARQRPGLGIGPATSFEVLLIGRDGGVKLRRTDLVAAADIIRLIDTMPMRRSEVRR